MFVKIFFTVNMFISIDYEVMINYVKEKYHYTEQTNWKGLFKKQTKKSNKLKQATKREGSKMKHKKKTKNKKREYLMTTLCNELSKLNRDSNKQLKAHGNGTFA